MNGCLVVSVIMDAFNNVDLAIVGPVGSYKESFLTVCHTSEYRPLTICPKCSISANSQFSQKKKSASGDVSYGQVPHPVGIWTESMMTRPPLNWLCVEIRTLCLLPETVPVVSTRITAFPWAFTSSRPLDR